MEGGLYERRGGYSDSTYNPFGGLNGGNINMSFPTPQQIQRNASWMMVFVIVLVLSIVMFVWMIQTWNEGGKAFKGFMYMCAFVGLLSASGMIYTCKMR
jgi:hypothetical protein